MFGLIHTPVQLKRVDGHVLGVEFLINVYMDECWMQGGFECAKDRLGNAERVAFVGVNADVNVAERLVGQLSGQPDWVVGVGCVMVFCFLSK